MSLLNILKTGIFTGFSRTLLPSSYNVKLEPLFPLLSPNLTPVRFPHHRNERIFRKIRGGGRPVREGVVIPVGRKYGWRPVYPEDGQYTTNPLPIIKMGGRHPETGRVVVRTIGGGYKNKCYWVDYKREGPDDGSVLEEKVYKIVTDDTRSAHLALVAGGDHKRWIIASENMKVGDIIKTSSVIPRIPIRPEEGNAHPVGALPVGTVIHNIEVTPGSGGLFCRAAGASAQVIKKFDNKALIQLPSKRQVMLDEKCMVVIGRASNIIHGSIHIGSPNRLRHLGKRPRSGLWHRKDGYCGRKIRPPKSILDTLIPKEVEPEIYNLTWRS